MADLYIKQAALALNATFRTRVQLALYVAMTQVLGEAQATMSERVYQKRQLHSAAALAGVAGFIDRYTWAVATNTTVTNTTGSPVSITSSSNTNPTVITAAAAHGLTTGDTVDIANHAVNTNANGGWVATVLTGTTFSVPTAANGAGAATGTVTKQASDSDIQFVVNSMINDMAGITGAD